jgi:ubiquinone/menaquinone biosynthesis C-methylase UbiE
MAVGIQAGTSLFNGDARKIGLPDVSVGAIFSIAVFEHLLNFDVCLEEMYRILVPGGYVFAEFGPIWSSGLGHHVKASVNGEEARHFNPSLNPVDNHSHLLLSPEEMKCSLPKRISSELADAITNWIYESDELNRMFYEEYILAIEKSPFELVYIEQDKEHVPSETLAALRKSHPSFTVFDVRNAEVLLRKPL